MLSAKILDEIRHQNLSSSRLADFEFDFLHLFIEDFFLCYLALD